MEKRKKQVKEIDGVKWVRYVGDDLWTRETK